MIIWVSTLEMNNTHKNWKSERNMLHRLVYDYFSYYACNGIFKRSMLLLIPGDFVPIT